ncbi:MAG: TonB-dependent receptor [Rubrivivax sp.]|nr:MAG: TonB-dependent receptor [Rubrivivax sp.]
MNFKPTPIACGLAALLLGLQGTASAQQADSKDDKSKQSLQTVVVTGIRASTEASLTAKRDASANVEVITAVDVGKMPDKNLADSLQRVAGVAVRTDYDEAEKVAMRGTNPDMTLILFNGHTVSGGDWYISDQTSSSRSTSLSLMPSSVLNSATVYKTSQANILDGGLAGTVNVTTRKPLDAKTRFGGVVSVGGVYATLPGKTSPQLSATLNWKSDDDRIGVIGQVFAEKRYVRRDSASRFAYGASSGWDVINTTTMKGITDASLAGSGYTAADLNGVRLPGSMSTEFVEGVRDRKGGMLSVQWRPTDKLDVGITGFHSKMDSDNYGRLTSGAMYSMLVGKAEPFGAVTAAAANTSSNGQQVFASITNPQIVEETTIYGDKIRVLRGATIAFAPGTTPQYIGNSEGFFRSGASASSGFLDLDATYKFSNALKVKGLFSSTRGVGSTDQDRGLTYARYGTGVTFQLQGVNEAPTWSYQGAGPGTSPVASNYTLIATNAPNRYKTVDRENSLALDAEYLQNSGIFQSLEFGARHADHHRDHRRSQLKLKSAAITAPDPSVATAYPGDFGADLGSGFDNTGFYYSRDFLRQYFADKYKSTTPEFERLVASEIELRERQSALYFQQNLETADGKLSGNVGLRYARTIVDAQIATPVPTGKCLRIEPGKTVVPCAAYPTAIVTAGDGATYLDGVPFNPSSGTIYYKVPQHKVFDDILPSLNARWQLAPEWIARLGLSKTLGRQNYNLYGAGFTGQACNSQGCTVNGPNPALEPMTSQNTDLSLGWYYGRRSAVVLSLFDSLVRGYPKTGAVRQGVTVDLLDNQNIVQTYQINSTGQQRARIQGAELSWEQPIWGGFGFQSNLSYADTSVEDGRPMVGASRKSANLVGYFETDVFSVRLAWNYRSEYVNSTTAPAPTANSQGLSVVQGITMPTAPTIQAPVTNVALTVNYTVMPGLELSFSGTNLTNPGRGQYRYSELEQQKVDASGRQYYVEARYKF